MIQEKMDWLTRTLKGMHKDLGMRSEVLVFGLWDSYRLPTLYEPGFTFMGMAIASL